jgi:hypothetical protein
MLVQYGDKCIEQKRVYEWVERFKNGRTNVIGEDRLCSSISSSSVTNVDRENTLIQENRWISVSTIRHKLWFLLFHNA